MFDLNFIFLNRTLFIQTDDKENLEYSVSHFENDFYLRTNLDALNFKLVKTPVSAS